ncbi:heparinase II/III family protein [Frankia sp. AgB32]|uniref:heparinase II/III domain-containing protein n=1 Tax=Frankia sp. AgB32 TaxID=631119 RepID=UPI00200F2164|nr:heparinase II/III family protein [Frankia sp. AgB32]MCK9896405.1 heparinase II/III family protein [Frankia sp. AgB32]
MRILVTGGTGFLGSRVVDRAVAAGHDVVGLARSETAAAALRRRGARVVAGDLADPAGLAAAFVAADARALLNIASLGFGHAAAILAATSTAGIRRAVFVSTTGIFTALDPPSKRVRIEAEHAIEASGLDWTIIRPTMIYGGPDDRNMARLLALVRRTPLVPLPGAACLHQPVHVDDLADTVLRTLHADVAIGRAYDVAGPRPLPFRDVVTAAGTAVGRRVHGVAVPSRPILALASAYERRARRPRLKAEQIARLAEDKAFDITAARQDLGHRPRPFDRGIAELAAATTPPGGAAPPRASRSGRYLRTVGQLRPGQIATRARLRGQRAALGHAPRLAEAILAGPPLPGHWPASFVPVDGRCPPEPLRVEDLAAGRITLLGHPRPLTDTGDRTATPDPACWDWEQAQAPLLWRYHLHYWDWAWALVAEGERGRDLVARLYLGWRAAVPVGHRVAWSPYVTSLRAWTLCALAPALPPTGPAGGARRADLAAHRRFLRLHRETDVGGNHLIKNLKAQVALAVAAGDRSELAGRVRALAREADRQVLADGGHCERAPAYHCQVLADLDDVAGLLATVGQPVPAELSDATDRMRVWLAAVLAPDGTVPLLNDGFPVRDALVRRLLPAVPPQPKATAAQPKATAMPGASGLLLAESGLAVLAAGGWRLLADVGLPCPPTLPAHAHADTLGFLLWRDGEALLVDTATSTYAPGARRDQERASAAHSTVTVDDTDSTEVWGAFRAGRRAHPTLASMRHDSACVTLVAAHDGYRHLAGAPEHRRTWRLDPRGLAVEDRISGHGRHRLAVRFHFAPGVVVTVGEPDVDGAATTGRATADAATALVVTTAGGQRFRLVADPPGRWDVQDTPRATGWERTVQAPTAELRLDADLPVTLRTRLTGQATVPRAGRRNRRTTAGNAGR